MARGSSHRCVPEPEHRLAEVANLGLIEAKLLPALPRRLKSERDLVTSAIHRTLYRRRTSGRPLDIRRRSGEQGVDVTEIPSFDQLPCRLNGLLRHRLVPEPEVYERAGAAVVQDEPQVRQRACPLAPPTSASRPAVRPRPVPFSLSKCPVRVDREREFELRRHCEPSIARRWRVRWDREARQRRCTSYVSATRRAASGRTRNRQPLGVDRTVVSHGGYVCFPRRDRDGESSGSPTDAPTSGGDAGPVQPGGAGPAPFAGGGRDCPSISFIGQTEDTPCSACSPAISAGSGVSRAPEALEGGFPHTPSSVPIPPAKSST